jgi:hypothetical protein
MTLDFPTTMNLIRVLQLQLTISSFSLALRKYHQGVACNDI